MDAIRKGPPACPINIAARLPLLPERPSRAETGSKPRSGIRSLKGSLALHHGLRTQTERAFQGAREQLRPKLPGVKNPRRRLAANESKEGQADKASQEAPGQSRRCPWPLRCDARQGDGGKGPGYWLQPSEERGVWTPEQTPGAAWVCSVRAALHGGKMC